MSDISGFLRFVAAYDKERFTPASEEAHEIWERIIDKPHYALPQIQRLIDERDRLRALLKERSPA